MDIIIKAKYDEITCGTNCFRETHLIVFFQYKIINHSKQTK